MSSPLVSVIIPAYNSGKFIEETLKSVKAQTYELLEVIVVDDGSTDNQNEIIDNFCRADNRFRCYRQSNSGVAKARNLGFTKSSGNYVAFLDADDVWLPDNINTKLHKLQSGDYGLVHSNGLIIDEYSATTKTIMSGQEGKLLDGLLAWKQSQIPGPSSILMSRQTMTETGLFDENLSTAADQDFFIRVSSRYTIGKVDEVTWHYRIHTNNMHKNIARMEHDVLYVFEKARQQNMFHSKEFERACFANMYLILAASWMGDGKNSRRAFRFLVKAVKNNPGILSDIARKIVMKWWN